ncbi:Vegetative incompatibility protein HET-E-1 OS=Podospora anserina GN=HET-E1 PE=4 SV=1 [Rhizoctonia solani AG-1 IB]|uniref:Vegetative incompatibility protein HET-E-1 n=2 Tax=Thanatephorus cucumeris (strain AG1-IB / isolate 7/3/14) TaxID=1108050 RepID=A0A0B7F902_THACB|nr:Vegetative incompatibility protein HET-E-1 OS=Podospora anserina GN=HET-E1 PE=4 SV=1 [Rhizoctonia solani AG-1 IB]
MSLNEAVNTVTTPGSTHWHERTIDDLYRTLLEAAFGIPGVNDPDKKRMSDILQMVVCAMEPMSVDAIATLLRLGSGDRVSSLLAPLRSVLNVTKGTGIVMTLHASFPDFMLSSDRSTTLHCQPSMRHAAMAEGCLKAIESTEPKFNICALPSSYLLDREVEGLDKKVSELISPGLVYACRYWSAHLELCQHSPRLMERVHHFFVSRLLLWMEIINLTKYIRYAASIIQRAEKWCTEQKVDEKLTGLVRDASQFVSVYANHPVSQSTPHIYASMLAFWPKSRPSSTAYMARASGLVRPTGTAIDRRQLALIATWKVSSSEVVSMDLTADGTRLVAPSGNSIEVYDTTTGDSMISLTDDCAKNIYHVAISGDGSHVAFSQENGIPYVWEIRNGGAVTQRLTDGISGVTCIAVSYDGTRVACGLKNGKVYIQGLDQTAESIGVLNANNSHVLSVVFSPNGLHLATASLFSTIRVWDVRTGQPVGEPLGADTDAVISLSYSHNGSLLASGLYDNTIRVWDLQKGQTVIGSLVGHSGAVACVAFSSNSAHIASGSWDCTIRVYDAHTGRTVLGPLQGHTSLVNSVIFSSDATRLFSCSSDGTVRIWNVQDLGTPAASSTAAVLSTAIKC